MGIYDRDYMRERARTEPAVPRDPPPRKNGNVSWRQRLLFRLWLLLHPKRSKGNSA